MMGIVLFALLSMLFMIEASTSLARLAGYIEGTPESGMMLQSSLSLISRVVIFMFMPLLGWLADTGEIYESYNMFVIGYMLAPTLIAGLFLFRVTCVKLFVGVVRSVNQHGSLFKFDNPRLSISHDFSCRRLPRQFYPFVIFVSAVYIPYYLSWPVVIYLIDMLPEKRGFLLGLSGVFNGINTILITFYVDPKLIRYGRNRNLIFRLYPALVGARIMSAFFVLMLILFGYYFE